MQHLPSTDSAADLYDFGTDTSSNTTNTNNLTTTQRDTTSSSNAHSITAHDYRFPRRPNADQQHYRDTSVISDFDELYDFDLSSGIVDTPDKLDPSSSATAEARKDMLRESIFAPFKDDSASPEFENPDELQKKDPLATQIWRLYSKTKKQLPNQERMENLTWRMMAMNLRKQREEEAAAAARYDLLCRHGCFTKSIYNNDFNSAAKEATSAPSGIARLRKSSDQGRDTSDSMNLDEFIFSDNISTPVGISPIPETVENDQSKPYNAVASAIPIKMRKEAQSNFVPQSVPVQHRPQGNDEFGYVQRHVRKTSIDERRVCHNLYQYISSF
jgi:GATA-binding protein